MVLVIVTFVVVITLSKIFASKISEIHRADKLLDKRNLAIRYAVFCVKLFIRPRPIPLLDWNEGIDLAVCVLRWLVQEDQ